MPSCLDAVQRGHPSMWRRVKDSKMRCIVASLVLSLVVKEACAQNPAMLHMVVAANPLAACRIDGFLLVERLLTSR